MLIPLWQLTLLCLDTVAQNSQQSANLSLVLPEPVSALTATDGSAAFSSNGEGNEQLRTAVLDLRSLFLKALI